MRVASGEQIGYVGHEVSALVLDGLRHGEIADPKIASLFSFTYQGHRWTGAVVQATLSGNAAIKFPRRSRGWSKSAQDEEDENMGCLVVIVVVAIVFALSWLMRGC